MSNFKSTMIAGALALAAFGTPAFAAGPDDWRVETTSVQVSYGDLNLDSDAGADAFLARVDRAATRACGNRPEWGPLMFDELTAFNACHKAATIQAVALVNSSVVSVRYAQSQGRKVEMAQGY